MAAKQSSTRARARNLLDISVNPQWLGAFALGLMLSFAGGSALGDTAMNRVTITNRVYPSDPTKWSHIGGALTMLPNPIIAPDGTLTNGFAAGAAYTGFGSNNLISVVSGEVDTFSVYVKYVMGKSGLIAIGANGAPFHSSEYVYLAFNALTGVLVYQDSEISGYSASPVPNSGGWWRVSIILKPTVRGMLQAIVFTDLNSGFAAWGAQFVTGMSPGRLIPTVAAPASEVSQSGPLVW